jgi:telomerase reverse transcriptase
VLSRYPLKEIPSPTKEEGSPTTLPLHRSIVHVMMYIFPRQFGLHNVFTERVDPCQTVQPFKDYTLREDEINAKYPSPDMPKIPKRLRGKTVHLVQKLQIQHSRCPYKKLLEHYCPVRLNDLKIDVADLAGFRSSNKSRRSRASAEL